MSSPCIPIWKASSPGRGRGRRDAGTDSHLSSMPPPPPDPEPQWPIPTFNVRIEDLEHPGAKIFLDNIRVDEALRHAVTTVCRLLYTEQTVPGEYVLALHIRQIPRLTSVLLVLVSIPLAYPRLPSVTLSFL